MKGQSNDYCQIFASTISGYGSALWRLQKRRHHPIHIALANSPPASMTWALQIEADQIIGAILRNAIGDVGKKYARLIQALIKGKS